VPKRTQFEVLGNIRADVGHDARSESAALVRGRCRDGLDVARAQRNTVDLQRTLYNRAMGHDLTIKVEDDVHSPCACCQSSALKSSPSAAKVAISIARMTSSSSEVSS
jgi:hypothetical protein